MTRTTTKRESTLWGCETAITRLYSELGIDTGVEVPTWIDQDISPSTVAAIVQGGCASGAYMPAVTYHTARETMNEHGGDVLNYIEEAVGEVPSIGKDSWSGYACTLLSTAVELWASSVEDELLEAI